MRNQSNFAIRGYARIFKELPDVVHAKLPEPYDAAGRLNSTYIFAPVVGLAAPAIPALIAGLRNNSYGGYDECDEHMAQTSLLKSA